MSYTILGVTGHIDHGKTSLVLALSGRDCDTHPEEKRRGITIDLGFASFQIGEHEFAVIDAPGHQRYVGNLLAGVSRVDIGLLVVAADQGIQAQTIEHAAILKSLGVAQLVCVVSRCDLASDDACHQLRDELELFLGEVGFADYPCIFVSTKSGQGLADLQHELADIAQQIESASHAAVPRQPHLLPFRLPVDREFHVVGRGQVVAGTVWSGQVAIGDTLQLARTGERVRVREIEQHGQMVEVSRPGRRTALNLAGEFKTIRRGDEFITPDSFSLTQKFVAQVQIFEDSERIGCPAEAQLHAATTACSVRLTGARELSPGSQQLLVLETSSPLIVSCGQPILIRRPYPVGSFAGGRVLADLDLLAAHRWPRLEQLSRRTAKFAPRAGNLEFAQQLADAPCTPAEQLSAWADAAGEIEMSPSWLLPHLGVDKASAQTAMQQLATDPGRTTMGDRIVSQQLMERASAWQVEVLQQHQQRTGEAWMAQAAVVQACDGFCSPATAAACAQALVAAGKVAQIGSLMAIATHENRLSKKQIALLAKMRSTYDATDAPPSLKELSESLSVPVSLLRSLARFAILEGTLVEVGADMMFAQHRFEGLAGKLCRFLLAQGAATVAEIRDELQLTRKHVIPLLEHCDSVGITIRAENVRTCGQRASEFLSESP